jgi:hypothetical protein
MRRLVLFIDRLLRRRLGVYEFSDDPDCLLRLQIAKAPHTLRLPGAVVEKGEPVLGLHLWNDHMRPIPVSGPDLTWGLWLRRNFERSLHLAGREMRRDPRLHGLQAVGATTGALVPGDASSGARVMRHLDFCVGPYPHRRSAWFIDFWENFYSWWLMWAYNPTSLRHRTFSGMVRTEMWMLAADFLRRYGGSEETGGAETRPETLTQQRASGTQGVQVS